MTATGRSNASSSLSSSSSSSSQRFHHHRHHQQSSSPCNLNLRRLRFSPSKCLCSPTTHPGSFRCAFHRRLQYEKSKTLDSPLNCRRNGGLNLRKVALVNSLARLGDMAVEPFRRSLAATLIKSSSLHILRRPEFRPRPSRFYALHKDQD